MTQINNLPTRKLTAGDVFPFFSTNNGDAAKASMTALSKLISELIGISGGGGFITQYSSPTETVFTVVVGGIGQSTWLIITPTDSGFSGQITLPDVSTVADQQELLVVTTNDIELTYSASGMTVFGAPSLLFAGGSLRLKYDAVMKRWYCVSSFTNAPQDQPYYFMRSINDNPTVIETGNVYVPAVTMQSGADQASGFDSEVISGVLIITNTHEEESGYVGLYNVSVVMSAYSSAGTHVVKASIGTADAAGGAEEVITTLTEGTGKPQQIVINSTSPMAAGDTLAVWLTDEHSGDSIYVKNFFINIVRIGRINIV